MIWNSMSQILILHQIVHKSKSSNRVYLFSNLNPRSSSLLLPWGGVTHEWILFNGQRNCKFRSRQIWLRAAARVRNLDPGHPVADLYSKDPQCPKSLLLVSRSWDFAQTETWSLSWVSCWFYPLKNTTRFRYIEKKWRCRDGQLKCSLIASCSIFLLTRKSTVLLGWKICQALCILKHCELSLASAITKWLCYVAWRVT